MITRFVDRFPQLIATANRGTTQAVDTIAHRIRDGAADRSRVRSGTMRDGWAVETTGYMERAVYNPTPWTIFNEVGTIYMAAQPMLRPEWEEAEPELIALTRRAWYAVV